jgi:hypothetical protein
MRIPLLNIHIITEATLDAIIKRASTDALKFRTKQLNVLMKDNDRLSRGLPKKKVRLRRVK